MSLDAYKERQDRAFDTFRSKFHLNDKTTKAYLHRSRSNMSKHSKGRTISASSFGDLSGQALESEELDVPPTHAPQLTFSPQIRKLEVAPWESAAVDLESPKKSKKSRTSIMRKLIRVTSNTKSSSTTTVVESLPELIEASTPSPPTELIVFADRTLPTDVSPSHRRSDIPLGKPLDVDTLQESQHAIAFGPVDPNILHLRHPVDTISENEEYKVMKPSRSTPQIEYELEQSPQKKDRMSRMFDSLQFD